MKVLIDTNVLLDVAQQRAPHFSGSEQVIKWCEGHPGHGFIAWHSVSNVYFILEKQLNDTAARQYITTMLDIFEVAVTGTSCRQTRIALCR